MNRFTYNIGTLGVIIVIVVIIALMVLAPICFDYTLRELFHKDIPWYGDVVCGWIASEVVIPLALILLIINWLS